MLWEKTSVFFLKYVLMDSVYGRGEKQNALVLNYGWAQGHPQQAARHSRQADLLLRGLFSFLNYGVAPVQIPRGSPVCLPWYAPGWGVPCFIYFFRVCGNVKENAGICIFEPIPGSGGVILQKWPSC